MRLESESSNQCWSQWDCGEINQDLPKVGGLYGRVTAKRVSTEMSPYLLAKGADLRHVERLECQHRR